MHEGLQEMAINYFHSLGKDEKRKVMKRIIDRLSEEEQVEIAKMILKKK